MQALTVRIEQLEPMRVAVVAVTSAAPEGEAMNTLLDWARPQGLLDGAFRLFGYDNCQPHPDHTYTAWLTVGPDVQPAGDITIQDFPGGLYAVTDVAGVEQISPRWKQLAQWVENSLYTHGNQVCLEEMLDVRSAPYQHFRLYQSIRK